MCRSIRHHRFHLFSRHIVPIRCRRFQMFSRAPCCSTSITRHSFQLFSRHIVPRPPGDKASSCFPAILCRSGVTGSRCFSASLLSYLHQAFTAFFQLFSRHNVSVHQASEVAVVFAPYCVASIRHHRWQLFSRLIVLLPSGVTASICFSALLIDVH